VKILLAACGVEFLSGALIAVIAVLKAGSVYMPRSINGAIPTMMITATLAGGLVTVLMSRALIPSHIRDRSPTGAAWVPGPWLGIAKGLTAGIAIGACAYVLYKLTNSHSGLRNLGPIGRASIAPGLPRTVLLLNARFLAPPTEELLWRGVVYGGLRRSVCRSWAAVLITALFTAVHIPSSLPVMAAITGLGLGALWCRLHWGAIGPDDPG
jgi:membrane protease YdiL (CAAX protease family)